MGPSEFGKRETLKLCFASRYGHNWSKRNAVPVSTRKALSRFQDHCIYILCNWWLIVCRVVAKPLSGCLCAFFIFIFYYCVVDLTVLSLLLNNIFSSLKNKNACLFVCFVFVFVFWYTKVACILSVIG